MSAIKHDRVETLKDTVIWMAKKRFKYFDFHSINAAIVSVTNDLDLALSDYMKDQK